MKYLSLFSGIGGFELGIKQAYENSNRRNPEKYSENDRDKPSADGGNGERRRTYPTCVGYSEVDKYAIEVYERHFNHKNYGDITKIDPEDLPEFDVLVGGFPCQAFSIAGKRGGFNDTRGTLFFDIARIAKQRQPRLLVLENVKGLLSHDKGRTFNTIITTLDELGYDLQWQVLNSKYHGVPQNRERVFIIGHLRGTPRPEVFPIGGESQETTNQREVAGTLQAGYAKGDRTGGYAVKESAINQANPGASERDRVYEKDGVSPTLSTAQGGDREPFIIEEIDNRTLRKLTPTECERLQGFPDGWTEGLSDTQRYKTVGNAVTVNVIESIFNNLLTNPKSTE